MRVVRFATELESFSAQGGSASGWEIDFKTRRAVEQKTGLLEFIAKERIRDEFIKILMTPRSADGVRLLEELNLLRYVLPELREGLGVGQNKHHIYTVFEHNVRALEYAATQNYSLEVRMASLLHDVGKPRVKHGDGPDSTFYNHEVVGAKMTAKILENLRFGKEFVEKVTHLVRCHLFYYNVGEVTPAGVRRFLARVGSENVDDLMKVREADRIGSGVPKATPYKIRHLLFMIEKVKRDPISPKMLALRGDDVMQIANIPPSQKIGSILSVLLEEVIEDPSKNERGFLESRVRDLSALSDKELQVLAEKARGAKEEFESGVEEGIKKKYHVT
jgi:poly(A) polymerase/tRNA nucleotidyltransferase (CCA-adding enzyme)